MSYVKFKRISYNIQQGSIIESWIGYTMLLSQIELFYMYLKNCILMSTSVNIPEKYTAWLYLNFNWNNKLNGLERRPRHGRGNAMEADGT